MPLPSLYSIVPSFAHTILLIMGTTLLATFFPSGYTTAPSHTYQGLYALFLFCTTWRIISIRIRPENIVKFAHRDRDVPRSIRAVWNHIKSGTLLSLADKGAWETVMGGDDQSEKVREWDWFRIGFEPMFVDYTASGTWFVFVLLVEVSSRRCDVDWRDIAVVMSSRELFYVAPPGCLRRKRYLYI